jgi:opacity protein-like surface antigen
MKRRMGVAVAVALFVCGSVAFAQMGDFGVRGGYQRLSDGDSGALVGGGFFRWDWHRIVMLEAAVLYHVEEVNATTDLELYPIQFSGMIYPLRRDYLLSPYILGGGGLYISRLVAKGQDTENEYDFGWHLGLGVDLALNDRVFLEGDFRYLWLDTSTDDQTAADVLGSFDSWMATLGIGFRL